MDWRTENCVIYVCVTVGVLGLFYLSGGSWHSLWMLGLLAFANYEKQRKEDR